MNKFIVAASIAAALTATSMAPTSAGADDGRVAAGIAGGLLGGLFLGGALAPRPHYYAPEYYDAPGRIYYNPPPRCYWTRGEPVWDDYQGVWRRPRIRVCE
jgi:hypothetical protein